MSSSYRTHPQVKFREFRELEARRAKASDTIWAVLVASKLARQTLSEDPNQQALLADRYPNLPQVARMNQRLDRASRLMDTAENELCTMAFSLTFALHEDFVRACMRLLVSMGKASKTQASANSESIHEELQLLSGHVIDEDALALFHLTRKIRNTYTHAGGIIREGDVRHYEGLSASQRKLWGALTGETFRVPVVGESAAFGVGGLIGALAIQKRLAYDVNLGLQRAIPRAAWADMAAREYFEESGTSAHAPTALRSVRGYTRGGFTALELTDAELRSAIERYAEGKKSGML